jgi:chemotaxis protein CheY-P-specific phosphatase CheC
MVDIAEGSQSSVLLNLHDKDAEAFASDMAIQEDQSR